MKFYIFIAMKSKTLKNNIDSIEFSWKGYIYGFKKILNENDSGLILPFAKLLSHFLTLFEPFNFLIWLILCFQKNNKTSYEVTKLKDILIDLVVLIKLTFAIIVFIYKLYLYPIIYFLLIVFAINTFLSIPIAIILKKHRKNPSSYLRATILGVLNYIELVFHFASFYAYNNCLGFNVQNNENLLENIDYLYFSFITVSTIGYGHLQIINKDCLVLVIIQAFIFLVFVILFLGYNLSKINE